MLVSADCTAIRAHSFTSNVDVFGELWWETFSYPCHINDADKSRQSDSLPGPSLNLFLHSTLWQAEMSLSDAKGIEVARQIKQLVGCVQIPFIVLMVVSR